ncbi:MAG: archease [Candidatus Sungbacteria bacterium]|nr:archease [Candidatus Sungbacteria bacterium]
MAAHKKFEIIPEDIGVRMRVQGKTCRELFRNALAGLAAYMKPDAASLSKSRQQAKEEISIETVDLNSLLVDFLSGVIGYADGRGAVFTGITFKKFGENFLSGELNGVVTDQFDNEVSAVSYSDVDIRKNPKTRLYEAIVTFEV